MCHKRKFQSENYKNCIESTRLENKLNHLEKNSNYDKRMQSNDSRKTYGYETNKVLVIEKEQIKFSNITKQCKKRKRCCCWKRKHKII